MPSSDLRHDPDQKQISTRQAYNIVSDMVVGPNVRWRDNLYQGAFIVSCVFIGAGVCAALMSDWRPGVLVGGFAGLVVGLFTSGIFLMIFRFVRHARGRHD